MLIKQAFFNAGGLGHNKYWSALSKVVVVVAAQKQWILPTGMKKHLDVKRYSSFQLSLK